MRYFALVIVVALTACATDPPDSRAQMVAKDSVALLFEYEGVRVYRFGDGSRYHYYAVPRNGAFASAFSEWSETCGKGCEKVITEDFPTITR